MVMIVQEPLAILPVHLRILGKLPASLPVAGAAGVSPPFRGGAS
jgi:hypothetical protein